MSPIETMLEGIAWQEQPAQPGASGDLPYVTHSGVLSIFGDDLRCFRLSDGQTVFDADDFERFCATKLGISAVFEAATEYASASNTRRDGPSNQRER